VISPHDGARPARPSVAGLLAAIALAASAAACAGPGLPLDEVTDAPLAIVYWDAATARKRQELIEQIEAGPRGPTREGVARIESLAEVVGLGGDSSAADLELKRFPGRIALLNPRTLALTPLPAAPPNARPLAWSRDHRRLLFNSSHLEGGRTQLYVFDRDSGEVLKLTHGPDYHLEGDYGPDDGLLVSWVRLGPDRQEAGLDVRTPTGGGARAVVEGRYPTTPRWSPDGVHIVYVEADSSSGRRDRSVIVRQTPEADAGRDTLARGREPVYTPDGRSIVYTAQTGAGWQLRRMRADGSGRAPLGQSVRDERWPAVSPDGRHVVYVSSAAGYDQLFIRRMDGSGDRILLEDGAVAFPVW
jgi:Tol biopolymer transport system component